MSESIKKNVALKRAEELLKTFRECMPLHEAICDTVTHGDAGEEPSLLRTSYTWREAVDPEQLEQFKGLLHFLKEAIFGVDCDSDSAVKIDVIDRGRDQRRPYTTKVPRISDSPTFKEIWAARRNALLNVDLAQGVLKDVEREFEFFMEDNKELFEKEGDLK